VSTDLARRLGPLDATMLVAGGIMGSGIFLVPGLVAAEVGAPGLALLVWLVCGLLALCGALCYAELSAAIPETGGTYPFLKRAYRQPVLPFLYAWSMLFVVYSGAIAAVATAFAIHAGFFLGQWVPCGDGARRLVAVGCIVFLGGMNALGVHIGGRIQTAITFAKIGALGVIIVLGFALGTGGAAHFTPLFAAEERALGLVAGFGTAMIAGLFAYNGWWLSSFVAGEVRDPERNVPRSIFFGLAIVLSIYILVNLAYMYALPFDQLRGSSAVAVDAMVRVAGPLGGGVVAAAVMVATFGTLNAQLLGYPRISFALGQDGGRLGWLARVHPRYRTPWVAILVQVVWASVLAASGTFAQLITFLAFPNFLFLSLAVAGLIILRRTEPELPRPYRVWGYPVTPLLFLAVFAWYLGNSVVHRFEDTILAILLMVSGVPIYILARRGSDRR
jgi:basic amino acid/polyamine antiporter, APA family